MDSRAWEIKEGNQLPAYSAHLTENGAAVNLSTALTVDFQMVEQGGNKVVSGAADILDAATGHVSYQWGALDTDTPGLYVAEWVVTWDGPYEQTFPNEGYKNVRVVAALG